MASLHGAHRRPPTSHRPLHSTYYPSSATFVPMVSTAHACMEVPTQLWRTPNEPAQTHLHPGSDPPQAKANGAASVLEQRCVDLIRVLAADMVQQANSGHPGAAMGCAPIAHLLWTEVMRCGGLSCCFSRSVWPHPCSFARATLPPRRYSPSDPKWANRDRFVLSNGHACALQVRAGLVAGEGWAWCGGAGRGSVGRWVGPGVVEVGVG